MNKNLEELKNNWELMNYGNVRFIIPILEGFEKRLKAIEIKLGIYSGEEIKKVKVGGTDPN